MNPVQLGIFLKKWHTRFGLIIAVLLIMLCITGILINHSSDLSLEKKRLPERLASLFYGISETIVPIENIDNLRIHFQNDQIRIYAEDSLESLTEENTYTCSEKLVSAAVFEQEIWIACESEINIYLKQDEEIFFAEKLNNYSNLPNPISEFGECQNLPCLISNNKVFVYEPSRGLWQRQERPETASTLVKKSNSSEKKIFLVPDEINWYRLALDLHAGRLFGKYGVIIIDLSAVLILILVITGVSRWWLTRPRC